MSLLPHQITAFGAGRRVLLVEDDDQVRALIGNYLSLEGFAVVEAGNVGDAVRRLHEEFDLVVTDVQLPGASGNELVAAAKARWPATQVIVITGLQGAQVAAEALNAGADRYLFKPFDMPELRAYLVDALSHRDGILADRTDQKPLTDEAGARGGQAHEAVLKGARALVRAVEVRDPYARGHSDGVASYAQVIAVALNRVQDPFDLDSLRLACELHDVGKIGVPDAILNKEGRLTTEEFQEVRRHPRTGHRILEPIVNDETVLSVVCWHHERWDGGGYPDALVGESIPVAARVVGAADALDAMTSDRAYRKALTWEEALRQIRDLAGTQFDPEVVACVERTEPALRAIWLEHTRTGV